MDSSCRCRRRKPIGGSRARPARSGASGAGEFRECVADDVKVESFPRSVKLKPNEIVVFSWITFKSRDHRDRVNAKVMKNKRFLGMHPDTLPFDGKRMIYGGFKVLVDV
jgi:uncharacterized protein YbaA (DUF1428 family)